MEYLVTMITQVPEGTLTQPSHRSDPIVSAQRPVAHELAEQGRLVREEITPLVPHPSDPAATGSRPAAQARRS